MSHSILPQDRQEYAQIIARMDRFAVALHNLREQQENIRVRIRELTAHYNELHERQMQLINRGRS